MLGKAIWQRSRKPPSWWGEAGCPLPKNPIPRSRPLGPRLSYPQSKISSDAVGSAVELQSNGSRMVIETQSNCSCNHRINSAISRYGVETSTTWLISCRQLLSQNSLVIIQDILSCRSYKVTVIVVLTYTVSYGTLNSSIPYHRRVLYAV